MKTTRYHLTTAVPSVHFTAAVVADLHDRPYDRILPILEREHPDCLFIPGDLTENLGYPSQGTIPVGLQFLEKAARLAPTFYSFGNHETGAIDRPSCRKTTVQGKVLPEWRDKIRETGAVLLDETWTIFRGMAIGGLGSGRLNPHRVPEYGWVGDFARLPGYKILLCHHPEYFDRYLRDFSLDLIVSGHAHGGQWRIFGRGVYAPDQKLFPRYTSGVHENRLVISRGAANSVPMIPRFFNPCEVVMITVDTETENTTGNPRM